MEKPTSRDLPKEQAEAHVERLLKAEREQRLIPRSLEEAVNSEEFKERAPNIRAALLKRLEELGRAPPDKE